MEKITLCGDDCFKCPRYLAKTEEELEQAAELWHRVGWRDRIVSKDEIRCTGCSSEKQCTYGLVECTSAHDVAKCNQCPEFPCENIESLLARSQSNQKTCERLCTVEEYQRLEAAFFHKEENLKK